MSYQLKTCEGMTVFRSILFLLFSGLCYTLSSANIYYVGPDGSDTNAGSQAAPFYSINHALSVIQDLDTIRVMPGDYYEQILIHDLSGVSDFVLEGIGDTVWIRSPYAGPVISVNYPFSRNTMIRNLFITHQYPDSQGCGVEIIGTAITIEKCTILENHASAPGGGIRITDTGEVEGPMISYCLVKNNDAPDGGGIYAENSMIRIENSEFYFNNANGGNGGGLSFVGCYDLQVNTNEIQGNTAESGAGVYLETRSVSVVKPNAFQNNLVNRNTARLFGGGMYFTGDAVTTIFVGNTFAENHTDGSGGGLSIQQAADIILNKNIVVNNTSYQNGAGIHLTGFGDSNIDLWSNQVSANHAEGDGGGLYLNNCNSLNIGGTLAFQNNFYHNRAKGVLNAIHSATSIASLNMDFNYWGFRNISAVQLQINIPGVNLSGLIVETTPSKISIPLLPDRTLYYFGDGFIVFREEALPLTGTENLEVDTQIDTSLFSGFNLNTLNKQYDFAFNGISQNLPADLFLYFDQSELENAGNPPKDVLQILAYSNTSGLWLPEPSMVDGIKQFVHSGLPNLVNSRYSIGYETVLPDTGFRVYPHPYRTGVEKNADIEVHFREQVQTETINDKSVIINGQISGIHTFELLYDSASVMAVLRPDEPFLEGEKVDVTLTDAILETSSTPFGSGFSWEFEIGAFRGNTTFEPGPVSAERMGSERFLLQDINNDQYADLIELAGNRVYIFENDGLAGMVLSDSIILGGYYSVIAVEDLDNDGQKEIVVVNSGLAEIFTFSVPDAGFVPLDPYLLTIGPVLDIAVADFDNDGIRDMCVLVDFSLYYQANFYYGGITQSYGFVREHTETLSGNPTRLKITDVDGNGLPDVVVNSGSGENDITLLLNQKNNFSRIISAPGDVIGLTGFETSNVWPVKPYHVSQEIVVSGFLNSEEMPGVTVYNLDAEGQLNMLFRESFPEQVVNVACADLTSDGINDLAVCLGSEGIQLLHFENNSILRGLKLIPDIAVHELLTGDLDLDGDMDLLVISQMQGMARWQVFKNGTRKPRAFFVDYRSLGGNGNFEKPFTKINEAIPRTLNGDTLFIYSGEYSENLTIDQDLVIHGYGYGPVRLFSGEEVYGGDAQISIVNAGEVRLHNFQLTRDTVQTVIFNRVKSGIHVENTDSVLISETGIYGFSDGISLSASGLSLKRVFIESCNIGLHAEGGNLKVHETVFHKNRFAGAWVNETAMDIENGNFSFNAHDPEFALGGLIAENNSDIHMMFTESKENGNTNILINGSRASFRFGGIFGAMVVNNNDGNGCGIYSTNNAVLDIRNSVIADNEKFGIYANNTEGIYQNNIIGKNDSLLSYNGAGVFTEAGSAKIVNNIFGYNNNAIGTMNAETHVTYNDFFMNRNDFGAVTTAAGNLYENPLFVSEYFIPEGQYTQQDSGFDYFAFKLAPGSPLIDRGDPDIFNPDSSRSDMGLFGDVGLPFTLNTRPKATSFEQDTLKGVRWDLPDQSLDSLFAGTVVYRSTERDFNPDTLNQYLVLDKFLNQFLDQEMVPGTEYFYKVAFFDTDGGAVGYSNQLSNRLDFVEFLVSRPEIRVQLGQEDTLRQFIQIKNTGTLQIRMQVLNDLPAWLNIFPMTRTIDAGDSVSYVFRFSAAGLPRDTLLSHSITFIPESYPEKLTTVQAEMLVSYRDLLPPQTRLIGQYPDSVFQSVLNFSFIGYDSANSSIGTPTGLLQYEYQIARVTVGDPVSVISEITDQTKLQFNPLKDGYYRFRVAAIDTVGQGGLGTDSEVSVGIVVLAGRSIVLRNVWQMVTPSRDIDQIAQFLFDERVLAVKHWVDEDYVDVNADMLNYGKGYWIISKESGIIDMNLMDFVDADTTISVELAQGWNQVGNPWAWNIMLDSCTIVSNDELFNFDEAVEAGILNPEIYYNEILPVRQYRRLMTKSLSPKLGYWIYANTPAGIVLNAAAEKIYESADILPTKVLAKTSQTDDILINLKARSGEYGDSDNFLGLISERSEQVRYSQNALDPPAMSGYLQLYTTDQTGHKSSDVRDAGLIDGNCEWNIRIDRPEPNQKLVLSWDWIRESENYHFFLYHVESGSWFNLNDQDGWIIENKNKINHLKLYASTDENFEPDVLPVRFELSQNYPNPFNMETRINLAIPYYADNQDAQLAIYDILGRKVKTLLDRKVLSGRVELIWDGRNDHQIPLASGLYIMRFTTEGYSASRKMVLIK